MRAKEREGSAQEANATRDAEVCPAIFRTSFAREQALGGADIQC